jgi:2-keto-3-deoxygluconate permease.
MNIKKTIDRIPGGLMLIPLLLGACCRTFFPGAPELFKGTFTNGLMTGIVPILAVWFFCMGSSIKLKATGVVLRKSGTIVLTKLITAWIIAIICGMIMPEGGMITTGVFAGISTLAIVSTMDMTNGGLYASLMSQYGTKEETGAFVLTSIESGPLMTMLILGTTGQAQIQPIFYLGAVLPFILGFALGNLDEDLRAFFAPGGMLMIPFFGFALGMGIDLHNLFRTGFVGIGLGLSVIVVTGIPLILADKFIGGGHGGAGLAASSTAGAAAANPMLLHTMMPDQFPIAMAEAATALVATSVVVTSLVVPVITAMWCKHFNQYSKAHIAQNKHILT